MTSGPGERRESLSSPLVATNDRLLQLIIKVSAFFPAYTKINNTHTVRLSLRAYLEPQIIDAYFTRDN